MKEQNDSHWWEFYGVRYAQGTVVGAMIIFFLFSQNEDLKSILFIPSDSKDFGMPHLILLAIYGLAYCYISSAPILIMHAARGLLFESKTNVKPYKKMICRLMWVFVPSLLISLYYPFIAGENEIYSRIAVFLYIMLVLFQFRILISIFSTEWQKTIDYYIAIVDKRKMHEDSGYVESYKHIREHGNSFLIVVFQFFLAVPIYTFVSQSNNGEESIRNLILIVLLWVLPAASIWAFGNKLENHLQEMP